MPFVNCFLSGVKPADGLPSELLVGDGDRPFIERECLRIGRGQIPSIAQAGP